jgi:two-component system response regulator FixJ
MRRSIYIVDDDDDVRDSLHFLLSVLPDTDVQTFASGNIFLEVAADLPPGVLLLDYYMPGLNGLEVLDAIGAMGAPFVPVVITAHEDTDLAVKALAAGACDFLEKPYPHQDLLAVLEIAFAQLQDRRAA